MAVRTTSDEVLSVLLDNYGETVAGVLPSLTLFIGIASRMTDDVVTCAANGGESLSDDKLKDIETLLAAHLYLMADRSVKSKQTERASATFDWNTDMGLDGTTYGQMAKLIDTSGCLASLGNQIVLASWLGKTEPEQLDYRDRME